MHSFCLTPLWIEVKIYPSLFLSVNRVCRLGPQFVCLFTYRQQKNSNTSSGITDLKWPDLTPLIRKDHNNKNPNLKRPLNDMVSGTWQSITTASFYFSLSRNRPEIWLCKCSSWNKLGYLDQKFAFLRLWVYNPFLKDWAPYHSITMDEIVGYSL